MDDWIAPPITPTFHIAPDQLATRTGLAGTYLADRPFHSKFFADGSGRSGIR
jgi:hypothetical protein